MNSNFREAGGEGGWWVWGHPGGFVIGVGKKRSAHPLRKLLLLADHPLRKLLLLADTLRHYRKAFIQLRKALSGLLW